MMLCAKEPKTLSTQSHTARIEIPQTLKQIEGGSNLLKRFRVEPGAHVKLGNFDPTCCGSEESPEPALPELLRQLHKMDHLQNLMYAERKHALLIILQGLDACGKDGVVRYILTGMNPAGCRVVGFKQPKPEEL
jgi:polyphosphate kinase 2 (PPK2 family)